MAISAGALRAGGAFLELFGKDETGAMFKAVETKLKRLGGTVARVGGLVAAASGAILAPLTASVFSFASVGDDVEKMAAKTGLSTEAVSELGFAAEQSGTRLDSIGKAAKGLYTKLLDAGRGLKSATDDFDDLGLSVADLQGMSPDELFTTIADALGKIENPAKKAALATKLFGRSGMELVPLFGQVAKLREEAKNLGLSISPEEAKQAAKLTDAMNEMKRTFKAVIFQVGGTFAPTLSKLFKSIAPIVGGISKWIGKNQKFVMVIGVSAAALGALGLTITAVGLGIVLLGTAIGGLTTLFASLGIAVGIFMSPFVLIPVLIAAAVGAFLYFSGIASAVMRVVSNSFKGVGDIFGKTFKGIISALESGDLEKASEIAWLGFETVALKVFSNILRQFQLMVTGMLDSFSALGGPRLQAIMGTAASSVTAQLAGQRAELDRMILESKAKIAEAGGVMEGGGMSGGSMGDEMGTLLAHQFRNFQSRGTVSGIGASRIRGARDPLQKMISDNTRRTAEAVEDLTLPKPKFK